MSPSDAESVFLGFAPSSASPSPSLSDSHANIQSATDQEAYRMKGISAACTNTIILNMLINLQSKVEAIRYGFLGQWSRNVAPQWP